MKLLLTFISCAFFAFFTLSAFHAGAQELSRIDNNVYSSDKITMVTDASEGMQININSAINLSGDLEIKTAKVDKVEVTYRKIIKTDSESEANEFANVITSNIMSNNNSIDINLQSPNPAPWAGKSESGRVQAEIILPENCKVYVNAGSFSIDAVGPFDEFIAEPTFGEIRVQKVSVKLKVSGKGQKIRLYDLSGQTTVESNNGDIRINRIEAIEHTAKIVCANGNVVIKNATGKFNVSNEYGKIWFDRMFLINGESKINGIHCPIKIELEGIENSQLVIENTQEDVDIIQKESSNVEYDLNVRNDGEIHMNGVPSVPLALSEERMQIRTGTGEGKISEVYVNADGGNINLEGAED